ncbi:hypothetical protein UYO_0592 [Lachnospiraceae bacterium JC7]|nr:hypothetical protein UYO_0592 [Lachnospiraceae bacterium JC7]
MAIKINAMIARIRFKVTSAPPRSCALYFTQTLRIIKVMRLIFKFNRAFV